MSPTSATSVAWRSKSGSRNKRGETAALSDEQERALLRDIVGGDRQAIEELYRAYHRRLARFLSRVTPRYELVEEIVNDTFMVVWQRAGQFRGTSRVSTWIIGIAYRRALKALRQAGAAVQSLEEDEISLPASDEIEAAEQTEMLDRALGHLPLEQRMVLELTYYLGHSCEEVAAITDCPVNTVKTRMFHARRKLKLMLPALGETRSE